MSDSVKFLNPASLPDFTSYNFSNAAVLDLPARLIYTAGQVALTKEGHTPADFEDQARLVFNNIKICLAEAGATVRNLVMVTMFCQDFSVTETPIWRAYEEFLTDEQGTFRPPCMIIPVPRLGLPQWHLEVSVQAGIPKAATLEKL